MSHQDPQLQDLLYTPLHALHVREGAKMVPFAGYDMPVQYSSGILAEHNHTRGAAGLFDVSHMGQAFLVGPDHETTARAFEALAPGDFLELKPGEIRYSFLLNDKGGVIDDLMVTRPAGPDQDGRLMLVVNAGTKEGDFAHIARLLPENVTLRRADERALLALQGPEAAAVLAQVSPGIDSLVFMNARAAEVAGLPVLVSRSGYTGEDGFEISVASNQAEALATHLLKDERVKLIGLGARDSLRLEAGLCLYGHDLSEDITPIEAALKWAIGKRRRAEGGFIGAETVLRQLAGGTARVRVGLRPLERAPVREDVELVDADGNMAGVVTSGTFGPTIEGPVAMGYVDTALSAVGTKLNALVRGKPRAIEIVKLPFVPHRYFRG